MVKVIRLPHHQPNTPVVVSATRADIRPILERIHAEQIELQIKHNTLNDEAQTILRRLAELDIEERAVWDSVLRPILTRDQSWTKTETIATCMTCGRKTQWLKNRIFTCLNDEHRDSKRKRKDAAIAPVTVTTKRRRAELSDRVWAILSDEEVE